MEYRGVEIVQVESFLLSDGRTESGHGRYIAKPKGVLVLGPLDEVKRQIDALLGAERGADPTLGAYRVA